MPTTAILAYAFYGLMFAALAYFLHKVAWFVRFRALQSRLVEAAIQRLEEGTVQTISEWDQSADASWFGVERPLDDPSPARYVRRIEDNLSRVREVIADSHVVVEDKLVDALDRPLPPDAKKLGLLRVPRLEGPPVEVEVDLRFDPVSPTRAPDKELYELEVRSRYGIMRRMLAFLLGAADVVYSSQHVARMSQNERVPIGLILRRLSLVAVILLAVLLDIAFGLRAWLIEFATERLGGVRLDLGGAFGDLVDANLPTLIALGVWLAGYGALYVGLYLFLRRRSQLHLRRLRDMSRDADATAAAIRERHLEELLDWAADYGHALDETALITVRQCEMLLGRTTHRLRRRVASAALVEHAGVVRDALFEHLPEASRDFKDRATNHEQSLRHWLWPRPEEMRHHVDIAQYRRAWQHVSLALTELRGERPDPELAHELWRSLVRYASMFPDLLPDEARSAFRASYAESLRSVVEETEADLMELDRRLGEFGRSLEEALAVVGPLVENRVELAEQAIEADLARLAAEVLQVRELARLEAMAFEI